MACYLECVGKDEGICKTGMIEVVKKFALFFIFFLHIQNEYW